MGNLQGHERVILFNTGSEICAMSEEVTRELICERKQADWKRNTSDGNPSDWTTIENFVPFIIHCIIIPMCLSLP